MFERRVLGVDPGLARLGLAVVDGDGRKTTLVWAGAVATATGAGIQNGCVRSEVPTDHPFEPRVLVDEIGVIAPIELGDRRHRPIVRMIARGRCPP